MTLSTVDSQNISQEMGIISTKLTQIETGSTQLKLLIKIPDMVHLRLVDFPSPCPDPNSTIYNHMRHMTGRLFQQNDMAVSYKYTRLCEIYNNLKEASTRLSQSYIHGVEANNQYLDLLQPPSSRPARGVGDSIRSFFGIAHRQTQKELQQTVRHVEDQVEHNGNGIHRLHFMVEALDKDMDALYNATRSSVVLLSSMDRALKLHHRQVEALHDSHRTTEFFTNHNVRNILNTIVYGSNYNLYLSRYLSLLDKRVEALKTLANKMLPHDLISPNMLHNALEKLDIELKNKYPSLQINFNQLAAYYVNKDIIATTHNGMIYMRIPVRLMERQETFYLYSLETFLIPSPAPGGTQFTLISGYDEIIALSDDQTLFFQITRDQYSRHCVEHNTARCDHHVTFHRVSNVNNCAIMMIRGEIDRIRKYCNILLITKEEPIPLSIYYLQNSSLLVINPRLETLFVSCPSQSIPTRIEPTHISEITVGCMCKLSGLSFVSPTIISDHCTEGVDSATQTINYRNLLYWLEIGMNLTDIRNSSKKLPEIEVDEFSVAVENDMTSKIAETSQNIGSSQSLRRLRRDFSFNNGWRYYYSRYRPYYVASSFSFAGLFLFLIIIGICCCYCKKKRAAFYDLPPPPAVL